MFEHDTLKVLDGFSPYMHKFWYTLYKFAGYSMFLIEAYQAPFFPSGRDQDGFNLGCYNNFVEVFGPKKWMWLLPVHSRFVE